jgi:hypothetical protein
VMSKSKALQRMIERLSAALGLMHRGRLYLNTRDMVRVFARKVASVAETTTVIGELPGTLSLSRHDYVRSAGSYTGIEGGR